MAVTSAGPYANNLHLAPEIHYIYNTKHYSVTRAWGGMGSLCAPAVGGIK